MIKTFRGILDHDEQIRVRLSTKQGKVGYRIIKFEVIGNAPLGLSPEAIISLWKIKQTSITNYINFADGNLLAAAFYENNAAVAGDGENVIVFDREIFNQDIFVTCYSTDGKINYYLELEVMKLSDNATLVSTLTDIRLNPQVGA